jgi:hypothetical protein
LRGNFDKAWRIRTLDKDGDRKADPISAHLVSGSKTSAIDATMDVLLDYMLCHDLVESFETGRAV